jgi:hypothetical protein
MLAVGIWAAQLRGTAIWLLPVTFVGVMSLGGLAGAAGFLIPASEPIILLSCLVFSALIVRRIRFSSQINVVIVAFFAFFHGFAHGHEISTSASLISYTLGFMVATILLHGAGILVVRLLVMIFSIFISHLDYAQTATNNSTVKLSAQIHTDNFHELIIATHPALPDNINTPQTFYSGEDGMSHALIGLRHITNHSLGSDFGLDFMRAPHNALSSILFVVSPGFQFNHQSGIQFSTNGVGATSPPIAFFCHDTPRLFSASAFCHPADIPVNDGNQGLGTTPCFDLPNAFTLATSFSTNGLGATSPPFLYAFAVAHSLDFYDIALSNSLPFKSSIALHPTVSRTLFPNNFPASKARLKSRLHSFANPHRPEALDT